MTARTPDRSAAGPYPGQDLGLPATGTGSLAGWGQRLGALVIDWAICLAAAVGIFGTGVLTSRDWRSWMTMAVFLVESALLTWRFAGSFGQLACRIAVVRLDRQPLGLPRAVLRAALVCLVLPALVIGPHRRGLQDLAAGTAVVRRR